MSKRTAKKIAFIASFPPRKCGIATFTSDLIENVTNVAKEHFEPIVIAMRTSDTIEYKHPVKFEIRQNVKQDYISAADYINFSHVDLVCLQHEFGLFGGDAGSYINLLLNRLNAPVITTLHTILEEPEPPYYDAMIDLCSLSYKVITMNEYGVVMLKNIYGIPQNKIELIPHGIPDLPFVDSNYYKHKFGMENRKTILTFGLLSKNKNIEVMLKALPKIIEAEPSVLYVILGMTHPSVVKQEGEAYRFKLLQMVKDLKLKDNVIFHNRFVNGQELENFLCSADIYVTPYLNREQLTSGTLAFAVGAGKPVISTPYWAATELLADGRGIITPFGDFYKLAEAVIQILKDDKLLYNIRRKAYDYGRSRTWSKIGQNYWKLFKNKNIPSRVKALKKTPVIEKTSAFELPEPSLLHFQRLTDDTGIFQHAKFIIPVRKYGYCSDDNARAAIAMIKYYNQYPEQKALNLFNTYFSFILDAQTASGNFRNFMNFDRTWQKNEPEHDALGRTLWAFGNIMATPPSLAYLSIIKDVFDLSIKQTTKQAPRGLAYSIFGLSEYLKQFPGASDIKHCLIDAADRLVRLYQQNSDTDWQWFEEEIAYDNAVLPNALFVAGLTFENEEYINVAEKTCNFLIQNTFNGRNFSFIGSNGWFKKGRTKAQFDQQPIEAASSVMMLRAAYDATEDEKFLILQRKAFDWFLGENDLHIPLYDFTTTGCCDGLMSGGVNKNQGAESTISFLVALMTILESYTILEKKTTKPNQIRIENLPPRQNSRQKNKDSTTIKKTQPFPPD